MRTLLFITVVTALLVRNHRRADPPRAPAAPPGAVARADVPDPPLEVTADEYQAAYSDNEVAANRRYLYKTVEIMGTVHAIKAATGVPYLVLGTASEPVGVHARFHAHAGAALAGVAKGDVVVARCVGGGVAGDVTTLHNCTLRSQQRGGFEVYTPTWP